MRGSSVGDNALWNRCAGNRRAVSFSNSAVSIGFRFV